MVSPLSGSGRFGSNSRISQDRVSASGLDGAAAFADPQIETAAAVFGRAERDRARGDTGGEDHDVAAIAAPVEDAKAPSRPRRNRTNARRPPEPAVRTGNESCR